VTAGDGGPGEVRGEPRDLPETEGSSLAGGTRRTRVAARDDMAWESHSPRTVDDFNQLSAGSLPGLIGMEVVAVDGTRVTSMLEVRAELLAPIGYLHAATVIALADTTCGYVAWVNLPSGASGFTTIELKANFLGTARAGRVSCEATLVHGGQSTQVWDATVSSGASGKTIALFRCTQFILSDGSAS